MKARKTMRPALRSFARTWLPPLPHSAGTTPRCVTPAVCISPSANSKGRCARSGLRREILAGLEEFYLRPALFGQPEIDPRGSEIYQLTGMIDREIVMGLLAKLSEALLVFEAHPSRHGHIDRLEHTLHA